MKKNKVAGLFAGIGGFELGFSRAGFETSFLCEIDPNAKAVLSAHFQNCELIDDVKSISMLPKDVGILCAGFPCQDLSSVGLKEGLDGDKSSLITEVFRILKDNPVEWVVIENVAFMLRLNCGQAIKYITKNLQALGYNWAYRTINSSSFLPQRRERVYIVASKHFDPRYVLLVDDFGVNPYLYEDYTDEPKVPIGFYWTEGKYSIGTAYNSIPPLKAGSTIGIASPPAIVFPDGYAGTPDIRDAERLQGFDADWTAPASFVSKDSIRWRLVGNAVTVNVVEWIASRLLMPGQYSPKNDVEINPSSLKSWPEAAWYYEGETRCSFVSPWPFENHIGGLDTFLQYPTKPLSVKATSGFLNRVNAGGLRTPKGFTENLLMHKKTMEGLKNDN